MDLHPGDVPAGRLHPVQPRGPGHYQHLQGPARHQDREARGAGLAPLHHLGALVPGRLGGVVITHSSLQIISTTRVQTLSCTSVFVFLVHLLSASFLYIKYDSTFYQ